MNVTIEAFGYPNTVIKEYKYWIVLLRPAQITVGTLVLAAKSEAKHLGQLTAQEWEEFSVIAKESEELLRETFGAEKFNYLALMMKDPNVHFHLIPRYSHPVTINDKEFHDPDWPLKTEFKPIAVLPSELESIKESLLANLATD